MKRIYIATTNPGKIKEIKAAFRGEAVELVLLEVEFDELEDRLKKSGVKDMELISKEKAKAAFAHLKESGWESLPVIVEDAGIYFVRLGDEPGIDTKGFVTRHGGIEGVKKIIEEGERAYFQDVLSYMEAGLAEPKSFVGKVEGRLSARDDAAEIEGGFPYNHIFIPDGYTDFMYKIPLSERAKFNHRFKAVALLKDYLKETGDETKIKMR